VRGFTIGRLVKLSSHKCLNVHHMNGSKQSPKTTICLIYTVNITELWNLGDTSDEHYPFSW